ncbi:zf-CCHC domain-containing protein [Tanacetum coccineum]
MMIAQPPIVKMKNTHASKDFKNSSKERDRFERQPHEERKSFQRNKDDKNGKGERKCFKCGDPNHLVGECPKLSRYQNQKAFVGGSWSDSTKMKRRHTKDKKVIWLKLQMRTIQSLHISSSVKRIQCARATSTANLPYGMFLTRLYRHVMETYPHLDNGIYDIVDRVMRPLNSNDLE